MRLSGGFDGKEGRVETYHIGTWGTVCAKGFTMNEAAVVCRMLQLPPPTKVFSGAKFGEGVGRVVLSGLKCNGTEKSIDECEHNGWETRTCSADQAVGVVCGERVKAGRYFLLFEYFSTF